MELITRPKLLFLDEPTSGLDSTTALSLMSTLKDLCERGVCTVVCTIHQPQTKIFYLLDNLLLMKKGEIVYQGACAKADAYFAEAGKLAVLALLNIQAHRYRSPLTRGTTNFPQVIHAPIK